MNNGEKKNYQEPILIPLAEVSNHDFASSSKQSTPKEKTGIKKYLLNMNTLWIGTIVLLLIGLFVSERFMEQKIQQLKYNCTPVNRSLEERELDVNSTLIKSLYSKVSTNIREDIADPNWNDEMKLYLAYRLILEKEKYNSNCNQFSITAMEPYTCEVSKLFSPKAFKEESLIQKMKELYGEDSDLELKNIQLGNTCLIGYQYIKSRGEYVEGYCNQLPITSFSVTKKLTKATSTGNTIVLEEKVKYYTKGGMNLPEYLKSGIYHYIFRLDMNYNYIIIDKVYKGLTPGKEQ